MSPLWLTPLGNTMPGIHHPCRQWMALVTFNSLDRIHSRNTQQHRFYGTRPTCIAPYLTKYLPPSVPMPTKLTREETLGTLYDNFS